MKVLLIRLSSMGDIIHTLPALTDLLKFSPTTKIDWLVEPGFQEISKWHPAVDQVFSIQLRRNQTLKGTARLKHIIRVCYLLRKQRYDLVIDAQGLLKSAVLARLIGAKQVIGLAKVHCRESIAAFFYKQTVTLPHNRYHAIEKTRLLFGKIFDYPLSATIDYGVVWESIVTASYQNLEKPYMVFLHGTTWVTKHWPDQHWKNLAMQFSDQGLTIYVTWLTIEQQQRAQWLSEQVERVCLLPPVSINQMVAILYGAKAVVAVDTGFGHLAAAMQVPIVSVYGPTDPAVIGTVGIKQQHIYSQKSCAPCHKRHCPLLKDKQKIPNCMYEISPEDVSHLLEISNRV